MPAPRRYAAFLRGVMPTNCAMPALRDAFAAAGYTDVRTVLGSGNVVFTAAGAPAALATRVVGAEPYVAHYFPAHAYRLTRATAPRDSSR